MALALAELGSGKPESVLLFVILTFLPGCGTVEPGQEEEQEREEREEREAIRGV